jgi:hypothetical protein
MAGADVFRQCRGRPCPITLICYTNLIATDGARVLERYRSVALLLWVELSAKLVSFKCGVPQLLNVIFARCHIGPNEL